MAVQAHTAQTTQSTVPMTGEELAALGDIGPCELVQGELIRMSPTGRRHSRLETKIGRILDLFVETADLGEVHGGEIGIYTQHDPDTVRGADVAFISHERAALLRSDGFLDVAPELIVEIMSPDDRWNDVNDKIREYFAAGVLVVWIVDPKHREIIAYRSLNDTQRFTINDELTCEPILPGFRVRVAEIFDKSTPQ